MKNEFITERISWSNIEKARYEIGSSVSQRTLGVTAFFDADVADGLGPFLVIDLTCRRRGTAARAGAATSMMLFGAVLRQALTGEWIDYTKFKRQTVCCAAIFVAMTSAGHFSRIVARISLHSAIRQRNYRHDFFSDAFRD